MHGPTRRASTPSALIPAWVKRFGSVEKAEDAARSHPDYGDAIRKIDSTLFMTDVLARGAPGNDPARAELAERRRNLIIAALAEDEEPTAAKEPKRKPRHRPPEGQPVAAIRELDALLLQRRKTGKPTQEEVAAAVERVAQQTVPTLRFDRNRVQQAEGLQAAGWPLLRSHPEFSAFSANDDFVYWSRKPRKSWILSGPRDGDERGDDRTPLRRVARWRARRDCRAPRWVEAELGQASEEGAESRSQQGTDDV
jgi:hypothetical protein